MSGQSSGHTPRTSTSSRPSASSSLDFDEWLNVKEAKDRRPSDNLIDGTAAANHAWDEHIRRRQRPRSSGGFLLQTTPATISPSPAYTEPGLSENARGKRKVEDGDLVVPKRASTRQGHRQKQSLGSSPLAMAVSNAQSAEQTDRIIPSSTRRDPVLEHRHGSKDTASALALFNEEAHQDNGGSAIGFDTDPAQIVNLALHLSESRRRNFSSGSHLIPRDSFGARRHVSTGLPTLALPHSSGGGSLRQHLQQQRQISRNVSPKSSRSSNVKGAGSPMSLKETYASRRTSALPDFGARQFDGHLIDASDATLARVEKARTALELSYEYRKLLQYLPRLPTPSRSNSRPRKSQPFPSGALGRVYNPLQYIRNRKVRFNEKRPLDIEGEGWNVIENVRPWVDTVAAEREDGVSRVDSRYPLPPFDASQRGIAITDSAEAANAQARKISRPHTVWEFAASDLLADAYWLHQDDNILHIEDSNGNKLVADRRLPQEAIPRTSKESARSPVRRSDSIVRLSGSPERLRASFDSLRSGSRERGRRLKGTKEPRSPTSDDNGSQSRKSRWPRKFARSPSPSSSDESDRVTRRKHKHGRDRLGSREEYDNAALEKHMMDILAREEENNSDEAVEKLNDQAKQNLKSDQKPVDRSKTNGQPLSFVKRRPSAPQRMRTDMPTAQKHEIAARASLDEQWFAHHRLSSDDFDSTAPNSPTAPGFVPSIAINLSPPASPPTTVPTPRKALPGRRSTFRRTQSSHVHTRVVSESDLDPDSGTLADVSRQTTIESQEFNTLRKERFTLPSNALLSPNNTDSSRGSIRSMKEGSAADSRFRGLFKGGRIAELVGSEVSKVGDKFWKKDNSSYPSKTNSPAPSSFASEESDPDDGDGSVPDSGLDDDLKRSKGKIENTGELSRTSTNTGKPKYHMSNLPSFQSSLHKERGSPKTIKTSPGHDHITRQQLALRERGRSSRFDRLAPPRIDMRSISPSPSQSPSREYSEGQATYDEDSCHSSSSRSRRHVRSADSKLNNMLNIPGKVGTANPAPTGLSRLPARQHASQGYPTLDDKRQWSISDRDVSAVHGTTTLRDIARVRAWLLSSGVKANEIVRRAEEIPAKPSPLLQDLEDLFKGDVPHLPRSQEYIVAGRALVSNIEMTMQQLRNIADHFAHSTVESLHHEIKDIDDLANYKLTPLVRAAADDADAFSTELTTTHTLAVKQLNDSVDLILRRRRRRLRWIRRWGWALLEWTLLGIMWMVWFVVVIIQLARNIVAGFIGGVRWLFWL